MSMSLSSPMEALAFTYLAHTVLNVWTWLAFVTAALSFWKIKSSIHSSPPPPTTPSSPPLETFDEPDPDQEDQVPSTTNKAPIITSSTTFCMLDVTKSGKFMVYYGDVDVNIEDDCMDVCRSKRRIISRCDVEIDGWEALLKTKTMDMGWYRYQDLTVLNGSVVQMWNQFNHDVVQEY